MTVAQGARSGFQPTRTAAYALYCPSCGFEPTTLIHERQGVTEAQIYCPKCLAWSWVTFQWRKRYADGK